MGYSYTRFPEFAAGLIAMGLAGISGAVLFAVAEDGYASFQQLGQEVVVPSILLLAAIAVISWVLHWHRLGRALMAGFVIGLASTIGLEAVRIIGFRVFGSMPGDLPTLMGVLLTGRIMQGPDTLSTALGYADHFWNGAAYGIIYVLLLGRQRWWVGTLYGLVLGTGFLASPVPVALGVGSFGAGMWPAFAITVYLAHVVFGTLIGIFAQRWSWVGPSVLSYLINLRPVIVSLHRRATDRERPAS